MKKISVIFIVLLGSIVSVSFLPLVNCTWRTPTQVTSNTLSDAYPSISDDGTKIAFTSDVDGDHEIFVINSDGTNLTQLTSNTLTDAHPSISGNGTKIAFESDVDGDHEIFVINSDGTNLTQLTSNTVTDKSPSISGDATEIAFYSNMDGEWDIFAINLDGSDLTQLTSSPVTDVYPSVCGYGSKIAYISGMFAKGDIFVVNQTDLSPPTGNIIINDGATSTDSMSVILNLSATDPNSGVPRMRLANDGETWSDWEPYVTSKSWTLTPGEGEKRVWVYFMNGDGLESTPAFDSIILDTAPSTEYHEVIYEQTIYFVAIRSNSTLLDLSFNQALGRIRFNVDGTTGTKGFFNVTIPSELMSGTFSIYRDDELLIENTDYTHSFNSTHYLFNLTYEHSTHIIEIFSTTVIPELSSIMLISTLIIVTITVIFVNKRKQTN